MTVGRNIAEAISNHFTVEVERVDQLYLKLYRPLLQMPAVGTCFFRDVPHSAAPSLSESTQSLALRERSYDPCPEILSLVQRFRFGLETLQVLQASVIGHH